MGCEPDPLVNDDETVTLFRPVGHREFELIAERGFSSFPPRLPIQPIFYPVLVEEYAVQIARDWNTSDAASGYRGYVARFQVRKSFLNRYETQQVGDSQKLEYWIPAEDLNEFNENIVGLIETIHRFGEGK